MVVSPVRSPLDGAASEQEKRPELRVVCLGDSITGPRPGQLYLHQYLKWPDLVGLGLDLLLGEGQAEVLNHGYAGDATCRRGDSPGAADRLTVDILPLKPDIAVILIGGNNFSDKSQTFEEHAARLRSDLMEMVRQLKASDAKVLLLQYPEPKASDMSRVWRHLNAGNSVIAEVAAAEGVETLPLAQAFAEAESNKPLEALLNPIDGVHLHPYGEIVAARTVADALRRLGWLRQSQPS